jgi:coenzyme F420-reducing hydrogenase alpha subunit
MSDSRIIKVDLLTRVEGEGALSIVLDGDDVVDVQLRIFEPPRFFEGFLQGRHYSEVPDIVARICGICPVAYQMSAVHAFEGLFNVEINPSVRALRRLLYCAEWIESHALHIYMLHAPDFLGLDSALELGQSQPALLKRALRLKKCGDAILKLLGGRAVHPVSVQVGGFSRAPEASELNAHIEELRWARNAALETVQLVAGFDFPDFTMPYTFVAMQPETEYPMNEGNVAFRPDGQAEQIVRAADYENHFIEEQLPHSNALHCRLNGKPYIVGPLSRIALNRDRLTPISAEALNSVSFTPNNPHQAIIARAVELLHAIDESIALIQAYKKPKHACAPMSVSAGIAMAVTEAPRGVLRHRYRVNAEGIIEQAEIVPPTAQNQAQMEADLTTLLPMLNGLPDDEIGRACERVVRSYDPCISCATHFLKVRVVRL